MIIQILRTPVLADKRVAHLCQIVCSIVAGLVMVSGVRRVADLDLTEAQLFSALTGTLFLTGVFLILAFQCRAWRRTS
jgi:hypothetical protein